jgi:hypothetical protein
LFSFLTPFQGLAYITNNTDLLYRSKVIKAKFDNILITIYVRFIRTPVRQFYVQVGQKRQRMANDSTTLNYAQYGVKESDGGYFSPIAPYVEASP